MCYHPWQQQTHTHTQKKMHINTLLGEVLIAKVRIGKGCESLRTLNERWDRITDWSKRCNVKRGRERWDRTGGEIKGSLQWRGGEEGQSFIIISQGCRLRCLDYAFNSLLLSLACKNHTPSENTALSAYFSTQPDLRARVCVWMQRVSF